MPEKRPKKACFKIEPFFVIVLFNDDFFPVRSDISGLATDRRAGDCLCPPSRLSDPQTDIRDTSSPWVETMAGSSGSPHDLGSPSLFLDLPEDDDDTSDDVPLLSEGTGVEQLNVLTKSVRQ